MAELPDQLPDQLPEQPARSADQAARRSAEDPLSDGGEGGVGVRAARRDAMGSDARNFGPKDCSIWESHVATRLGVSRRDLVSLRWRHLQEGLHFVKNGRRIVYAPSGVEKLAQVLQNGSAQEKWLPTNVLCEGEAEEAMVSTFKVRRKVHNNRVLECLDENNQVVIVRVRDNEKFLPGMEVTAVPYGDLKNVFEFVGSYPRFRGKY